MPQRIEKAREGIQQRGPSETPALGQVDRAREAARRDVEVRSRVLQLLGVGAAPDDPHDGKDDGPAGPHAARAREMLAVQHKGDEVRGHHLREPVQHRVERARTQRKDGTVEVLLLPGVKQIGPVEQREEQHDPVVGDQQAVEAWRA